MTSAGGLPDVVPPMGKFAMREVFRLHLDDDLSRTIVALGGDLKCSVALGSGRDIVLYEEVGDLEILQNQDRFEAVVTEILDRVAGDQPVLVCDKHPGYVSSRHGRQLVQTRGLRCLEVQHHRAHIVSVAAEFGLLDHPIIGLAFDGTGYGDDGLIWGGEIFVGRPLEELARRGSFAPLTLCGGDAAVRQPWRIALAWLIEKGFSDDRIAAWAERIGVPLSGLDLFKAALERNIQCVKTTALGRWFDCFAALWGVRTEIEFEAQAAIELQKAAEEYDGGCILGPVTARWMCEELAVITFDEFLETVEYMLDSWSPNHAAAFAREFHASTAASVAEVSAAFAEKTGADTVCCGGGCFLNSLFCGMLDDRLQRFGLRRVQSKDLPPGDQALALGQVILADRELKSAPT